MGTRPYTAAPIRDPSAKEPLIERRTPRSAFLGAGAGLAALLLAARNLDRFEIADDSMLPTLSEGDYVATTSAMRRIAPGDLVVFEHPGRQEFHLVKRVVASGDSTVRITRGVVVIDDKPEEWGFGPTPGSGVWHVGRNQVFVLGDLRSRSTDDSRDLGPIDAGRCHKVILRYWPLSAWRYF